MIAVSQSCCLAVTVAVAIVVTVADAVAVAVAVASLAGLAALQYIHTCLNQRLGTGKKHSGLEYE